MTEASSFGVTVPGRPESCFRVTIGYGIKGRMAEAVGEVLEGRTVFLLTDHIVQRCWGEQVVAVLEGMGVKPRCMAIEAGEKSKTWATAGLVLERMVEEKMDRRSVLVSLGGGVVGDLGGFASSVYMRGISLVQIPTTLLAQVDSCLGGKTGVDLPTGKNMVGTFHQPEHIFVDTEFLSSLPVEEIRNGASEVVKYGLIADEGILAELEKMDLADASLRDGAWLDLVKRCLKIKAGVIERDPLESGERMILNFGHTVGHGVEVSADYELPHGAAVAVGMVAASRLSSALGLLEKSDALRIEDVLRGLGLPVAMPGNVEVEEVLSALFRDKKALQGRLRWVLLKGLGRPMVTWEVPVPLVRETLEGMRS